MLRILLPSTLCVVKDRETGSHVQWALKQQAAFTIAKASFTIPIPESQSPSPFSPAGGTGDMPAMALGSVDVGYILGCGALLVHCRLPQCSRLCSSDVSNTNNEVRMRVREPAVRSPSGQRGN